MTRQLGSNRQHFRRQVATVPTERVRLAYLVMPYRDNTSQVLVQFTNPQHGSRGVTLHAKVNLGLIGMSPDLDAGFPVTVVMRQGRLEVIGF